MWVVSVSKSTKSLPMNMKTLKKPFGEMSWLVSRDLTELCLQDHQKLGQTQDQMQSMVNVIKELAAKLGNEKVFKWALRNDFYIDKKWHSDVFKDVAENGHLSKSAGISR
jgi:hypothetical protein